jgi:D-beta-D-heptose 7-phosphate kinase/D-beta-D-heptose 1-phosphate adenosyltransferase
MTMQKKAAKKKTKKKVVVAVSGGFDPIHIGHVRYLTEAKKLGDELVVILNNDNWLKKKKGFVFMPESERIEVLMGIKAVDRVVVTGHAKNDADTSVTKALAKVKPDFFANGGDRKNEADIPEVAVCKKYGIKMVFGVDSIGWHPNISLKRSAKDHHCSRNNPARERKNNPLFACKWLLLLVEKREGYHIPRALSVLLPQKISAGAYRHRDAKYARQCNSRNRYTKRIERKQHIAAEVWKQAKKVRHVSDAKREFFEYTVRHHAHLMPLFVQCLGEVFGVVCRPPGLGRIDACCYKYTHICSVHRLPNKQNGALASSAVPSV